MKKQTDALWIKLDANKNKLVCDRCGGTKALSNVPVEIKKYGKMLTQFASVHRRCTP